MADAEPQSVAGRQPAEDEPEPAGARKHTDDDEPQLVAGRKPAVKVGGMRVVQHKPPNTDRNQSAELGEDVTGLTKPPNINTELVGGAKMNGNADFPSEAVQVAHAQKPPHNVAPQRVHNINQPRKQ